MGGTVLPRFDGVDRELGHAAIFHVTCGTLRPRSVGLYGRLARGPGVARGWIVLRGISRPVRFSRSSAQLCCLFHNYSPQHSAYGSGPLTS
jgi:hypothetical protein